MAIHFPSPENENDYENEPDRLRIAPRSSPRTGTLNAELSTRNAEVEGRPWRLEGTRTADRHLGVPR